MSSQKPEIYIFAGPNGSGKSSYLSKQVPFGTIILDPDKIARQLAEARGLSPEEVQEAVYNDNSIKLRAMRELTRLMKDALEDGQSFATETALNNSRTYKDLIMKAHDNGYKVHLWYVGTESAETNMERVTLRLSQSGHGVPYKDVVKRYEGSLESLKQFVDMADEAKIYDNSITGDGINPKLMLCIENGKTVYEAPKKTMPRWVKENVHYLPEIIKELQESRKEAIKITQELTGAGIITDAVPEKSYDGKIIAVTDKYVIQQSAQITKHGEPIIVLHRKEDLLVELSPNDSVTIRALRNENKNTTKSSTRQEALDLARKLLGAEVPIVTDAMSNITYENQIIGATDDGRYAIMRLSDNQAVIHKLAPGQTPPEIGKRAALTTDANGLSTAMPRENERAQTRGVKR
jgi:predicted ABC-type ATPase